MDKKAIMDFVFSQLEEIRVSRDAQYSSGIASSLKDLIALNFPREIIKLSVIKARNGAIINAIKELRAATGLGLKEAKDAVEQGHIILETTDVKKALQLKKALDPHCLIKVEGSDTLTVLFGEKNT